MRKLSIALAALVACSGTRPRPVQGEVLLTLEGRVEHTPVLLGKRDIASLPRRAFRAVDPRSAREATFEGPSLAALLQDRAELAREVDTVVVRCRDGYHVAIPLAAIRQLKPILADRADGQPVADSDRAPIGGPFLLAWPNLDAPGLDTDPRARSWWATGVIALKAVEWQRTYGAALRIPTGAADEARLGSEAFSLLCMQCHRVRGIGGVRGSELTNALKNTGPERFTAAVRHHPSRLEPSGSFDPPPDPSIRQIATFLRVVAEAGPANVSEEPKPEPTERREPPSPLEPLGPPR